MGTLTTINMYWQHGRSVTEIWGRDEIKNVNIRGVDETNNLDLSGDEIQIWSCIHKRRRRPSYNGHNVLQNRTLFCATFRLNVHICICAIIGSLDTFLNKSSRRALRKTILRDFRFNLWNFCRRGGSESP